MKLAKELEVSEEALIRRIKALLWSEKNFGKPVMTPGTRFKTSMPTNDMLQTGKLRDVICIHCGREQKKVVNGIRAFPSIYSPCPDFTCDYCGKLSKSTWPYYIGLLLPIIYLLIAMWFYRKFGVRMEYMAIPWFLLCYIAFLDIQVRMKGWSAKEKE